MTHYEWAKTQKLSRPCSAHDLNFGGSCFNCGYDPNMTETKQGTKWVGKGEGAKRIDLMRLLDTVDPRSDSAWDRLLFLSNMGNGDKYMPTNLALTGEPLTDEDLKRIAECE